MKKLLALLMAGIMLFSFAACGDNKEEETTTDPEVVTDAPVNADGEETTVSDVEDETEAEGEEETEAVTDESGEEVTDESGEVVTEKKEEATKKPAKEEGTKKPTENKPAKADPSKWSNQEIIDFYKAAAAKGEAKKITCVEAMTLGDLDGGDGLIGSVITAIKPIAVKALEKNSNEFTGVTGGFEKLSVSDCKTIKAYKSGNYTAVEFTLKEQVTGVKADSHEGTVGHAISVLGNVDDAISQLEGVSVDYSKGSITLTYKNPYVKVLIDDNGNIVKGTWHHEVNVLLTNVSVGVAFISATLNGTKAVVNYHVTTGGGF